jgi:peptide/nickel transport system permease protein
MGTPELIVLFRHALRNAALPVVTIAGLGFGRLLGGTVIIETIFGLPGMSRFLFDAINQRDYPVIQGVNLVVVSTVVLINLGVDALYAVLDPRIRY